MDIQKVNIDEVRPYWRNPRKNDSAVDAVKLSIEQFGYNQPIVIDSDGVIVVGHTRYKALRQLGHKEIAVVRVNLTEQEAKSYRIVDNKTHDMAQWDFDALMFELREIEAIDLMEQYFGDDELNKLLQFTEIEPLPKVLIARKAEVEQTVRGIVMQESGNDVSEEEIEQAIQERVNAQMDREHLNYRNRQVQEEQERMASMYSDRSDRIQDDYVHVVCPHCDETMILSLGELSRMKARERRS